MLRMRFVVVVHFILMGIFLGSSCNSGKRSGQDQSIPSVEIQDYGKALFAIDTARLEEELLALQPRFPFFLDADVTDPFNQQRIREFILDPFLRDVSRAVEEVYPDYSALEKGFTELFERYHFHFPAAPLPRIFAYVSGLHYEVPVNLVDTTLLIAIDLFLGEDAAFYRRIGMPRFVAQRCTPAHVLPLSTSVLAASNIKEGMQEDDLLSLMLTQGRLLHITSLLLPGTPEHLIIGYSPDQYQWCLQNEEKIWAFLVNKDLIFSKDPAVTGKFMRDGPFTISFPESSPARLGWWVGWRIVQAYMKKNPSMNIPDLLEITDGHALLRESSYRPR